MKSWRRTGSGDSGTTTSGPPEVELVQSNVGDPFTLAVQFDQDVTWDGVGPGTMLINGDPLVWNTQAATDTLIGSTAGIHLAGEPWTWAAPDPSLTPVPDPTGTGMTT